MSIAALLAVALVAIAAAGGALWFCRPQPATDTTGKSLLELLDALDTDTRRERRQVVGAFGCFAVFLLACLFLVGACSGAS